MALGFAVSANLIRVFFWEEAFLPGASTPLAVRFVAAFIACEVRWNFTEDVPKRVRLLVGWVRDAILTTTTTVEV